MRIPARHHWRFTLLIATAASAATAACASNTGAGADDTCVGPSCNGDDTDDTIGPLGPGVATLAGTGKPGDSDGARNVARFDDPTNVMVAPDGRVFIADYNNSAIRVATPEGTVATLTHQDGFSRPFGMVLSRDGKTLFVSTDRNDRLQQTPQTGTVWRIDMGNGKATVLARDLGRPRGLAVLPDGRLVLADNQHHTLRLMDPVTGAVFPLAGLLDAPGRADGRGDAARFDTPYDVVVDSQGDILVADFANHMIRKVTIDGVVSPWAGTGQVGWKDGKVGEATFQHPQGLAIDKAGDVYVTDADNYCIRRIDASGHVTTVAGNRMPGFKDGARLQAELYGLEGIDVTADGSFIYVADGDRGEDQPYHRVRRVMAEW